MREDGADATVVRSSVPSPGDTWRAAASVSRPPGPSTLTRPRLTAVPPPLIRKMDVSALRAEPAPPGAAAGPEVTRVVLDGFCLLPAAISGDQEPSHLRANAS